MTTISAMCTKRPLAPVLCYSFAIACYIYCADSSASSVQVQSCHAVSLIFSVMSKCIREHNYYASTYMMSLL